MKRMDRTTISTENAPGAIGPYAQAVGMEHTLYLSGQLGVDPQTGVLMPDIASQTHQAMKNIGAVLAAAGMEYQNIVKTTIFLKDMADFATVNEAYASYFNGSYPARSCVQVAALPKGGLVEIECIAAL